MFQTREKHQVGAAILILLEEYEKQTGRYIANLVYTPGNNGQLKRVDIDEIGRDT